jgi:hypothetical protein
MAAFNKFLSAVEYMATAKIDWDSDTFKVMLTNTAPVNTNTVKANITEISSGNGYTAGGANVTMAVSRTGGTLKVVATDVTFTASGGSIGPFRYAVIYDDTIASPIADPLICWFDYGSSITLADTETFTVDFDGTNGLLTLA